MAAVGKRFGGMARPAANAGFPTGRAGAGCEVDFAVVGTLGRSIAPRNAVWSILAKRYRKGYLFRVAPGHNAAAKMRTSIVGSTYSGELMPLEAGPISWKIGPKVIREDIS